MNTVEETINHDSVKELTRSLFLINGLYKKLEDEREYMTTAVSQMTFVSKEFQDCSQRITEKMNELDTEIQTIISREIRNVAKSITEEVSCNLIENLLSKSEEAAKSLQQISNKCERDLRSSSEKISFFSKWFMSVAVGGALIGGLLAGTMIHYLPPRLDQRTKEKIHGGELLVAVWPKLDQKEREKILEINKTLTIDK